MKTSQEN